MSEYISKNAFLTREEMTINARYIAGKLLASGWTLESIAAMLGNMETESTINPGIWENLDEGNFEVGFGLVQWTPATKYTSWCVQNILDPYAMDSALARIEYELENGLQWISTDTYPLTFRAFKTSTLHPSYLAMAFLYNYERPASLDQLARGTQATAWYELLAGTSPSEPLDPPSPSQPLKAKKMPLWLLIRAAQRK